MSENIVNSQAFAVINMQIDEKVDQLRNACSEIAFRVNQEPKFGPIRINVRTVDEGEKQIEILFNISWIDSIIEYADQIKRLPIEIKDLQALKLRLLNDYDFTKGDSSDQEKIFARAEGHHRDRRGAVGRADGRSVHRPEPQKDRLGD
jgi:hypothetical protein